MAVPKNITVTDIPDADLQDFLSELEEEDKYDVVEKSFDAVDGIWTIKLTRKT